ncbi:glycoside hydrolase family 88 protein [Sphingomonas sp. LB-2]|uniref:glycoside hydrolase family 88/105 protein n=1 Tax=Sphingomonas caeni TaxID=2984949 RepID=UPI002231FDC5|nr:glycoside hydrolase family 88 protein [Sphingomonas caeni]MCW3848965.1 glycoside hydrolase family 88 protein [Sphingomonas caeni]
MLRMFAALAAMLLAVPAQAQQLPPRDKVLASMERLADWQLAHLDPSYISGPAWSRPRDARDWQAATFWVALTGLADRSKSSRFIDAIRATGTALGWTMGERLHHADDHLIGSAWIWAAQRGTPEVLAPTRAQFDRMLAAPSTVGLEFIPRTPDAGDSACTDRWCWCDALFMAPPTLWQLSKATGDPRYADFADREFRATTAYLLDLSENLYFRDSRFFSRKGTHGEKLFWSRGNGWVFSGLARIIPSIARDDPRRAYYVGLFRRLAARLVKLQRPNGYWPPSLLGDPVTAADETSGTAFFVHGMAWGIHQGILDRGTYLPAVTRGWAALNSAIQPDGRLGWVQQVSDRPDAVAANDSQFYGTGAYLLAGAAILDLETVR